MLSNVVDVDSPTAMLNNLKLVLRGVMGSCITASWHVFSHLDHSHGPGGHAAIASSAHTLLYDHKKDDRHANHKTNNESQTPRCVSVLCHHLSYNAVD